MNYISIQASHFNRMEQSYGTIISDISSIDLLNAGSRLPVQSRRQTSLSGKVRGSSVASSNGAEKWTHEPYMDRLNIVLALYL
jgi:hypothetical protein